MEADDDDFETEEEEEIDNPEKDLLQLRDFLNLDFLPTNYSEQQINDDVAAETEKSFQKTLDQSKCQGPREDTFLGVPRKEICAMLVQIESENKEELKEEKSEEGKELKEKQREEVLKAEARSKENEIDEKKKQEKGVDEKKEEEEVVNEVFPHDMSGYSVSKEVRSLQEIKEINAEDSVQQKVSKRREAEYECVIKATEETVFEGEDEDVEREKVMVDRLGREVAFMLERGVLAADLKISLYMAACLNGNMASRVKPFPVHLVGYGTRAIQALVLLNVQLPSLAEFYTMVKSGERLPLRSVGIFHWLLVENREPRLVPLSKQQAIRVLLRVSGGRMNCPKAPSALFKLTWKRDCPFEARWQLLKQGLRTRFAFLVTPLDVLFTEVLTGCLGRRSNSMVLTTDLAAAFSASTTGLGWSKSSLGSKIKVITVVELIEHPAIISCRGDSAPCSITLEHDHVTSAIYLTDEPEFVRLRYLAVYTKSSETISLRRQRCISRDKAIFVFCMILSIFTLKKSFSHPQFGKMMSTLWGRLTFWST